MLVILVSVSTSVVEVDFEISLVLENMTRLLSDSIPVFNEDDWLTVPGVWSLTPTVAVRSTIRVDVTELPTSDKEVG